MQATVDPADGPEAGLCGTEGRPHLSGEEEPSREKAKGTKQERRTSYSQLLAVALKIKAQKPGRAGRIPNTCALRYFSPG